MCIQLHTSNIDPGRRVWLPHVSPGTERPGRSPMGRQFDKVDASFKKGVLTVTLPKTAEAQKAEKKIAVKAE